MCDNSIISQPMESEVNNDSQNVVESEAILEYVILDDSPIETITGSIVASSLTQFPIIPLRTDVNGVSFQNNHDGNSIYIPAAGIRRKIASSGEIAAQELIFEEGYDSDDNLGPFYDEVGADDNIEDYEEAPCITLDEMIILPDIPPTVNETPTIPTEDDTYPTNKDITPTTRNSTNIKSS